MENLFNRNIAGLQSSASMQFMAKETQASARIKAVPDRL